MRFQVAGIASKDWSPRVWPNVLIIVVLAAGWLVAGCAGTQSPQELCGSVSMVSGQPQVVVVLVDGIGSSANEKGSFYPVPVDHPENGKSMVTNYCPVDPNGNARNKDHGWPAGLELGLRKWSSFSGPEVPGESIGTACEASTLKQDKNSCLIARLADAGAVLLPYSYTGATLSSTPAGPLFNISAYTKDNSKQKPYDSMKQLDNELYSIHTVWQQARIVIVAHSNGGMIAEMWWECLFGGNCPVSPLSLNHQPSTDHRGVVHVFSLDSPINGVYHCALAAVVRTASVVVADQWCLLWDDLNHEQKHDHAIIKIDTDGSFTPVGTRNDPTYSDAPLVGYNGGINSQVVYSSCDAVGDACMAQPPSYVSPCDGKKPIFGTTGHFIVRVCPQVIQLILWSVLAARDSGKQEGTNPGAGLPTPTLTASTSGDEPNTADLTFSGGINSHVITHLGGCRGPGHQPILQFYPMIDGKMFNLQIFVDPDTGPGTYNTNTIYTAFQQISPPDQTAKWYESWSSTNGVVSTEGRAQVTINNDGKSGTMDLLLPNFPAVESPSRFPPVHVTGGWTCQSLA